MSADASHTTSDIQESTMVGRRCRKRSRDAPDLHGFLNVSGSFRMIFLFLQLGRPETLVQIWVFNSSFKQTEEENVGGGAEGAEKRQTPNMQTVKKDKLVTNWNVWSESGYVYILKPSGTISQKVVYKSPN